MAAAELLPLRSVENFAGLDPPTSKIQTEEDITIWKTTQSYRDYGIFLRRLNESVVGVSLPETDRGTVTSLSHISAIDKMLVLLETLDSWIDQIPALESPQRFGNLAFRAWGKRLEEEGPNILNLMLPLELHGAIPLIIPYLLTSFGSFLRMDYGTGHETSFALLLLCLSLVRFFNPVPQEERALVLSVFVKYLRLCWRLQDVYRLEPAGSHGVWGLDDSHFLGYIFGSGQLRDQKHIPVSAILKTPLPPTNLYFMSIMRIHEVKQGPFHEHSSQLHSIAVGVPNWGKVNTGLFKMYDAEVLSKRVVVQHIPLGGLLQWKVPSSVLPVGHPPHVRQVPTVVTTAASRVAATQAPWASSTGYGTSINR